MEVKDRLVGIDALRGLAILGMFAAHVGPGSSDGAPGQPSGWGWLWVFDGRSAATFAVLVGVSMTLLAQGHSVPHSRARIATRAILLVVLGLSLEQLHTPIVCILVNTGLMMLAGMWALRARARVLVALALVFAAVGPFVRVWIVRTLYHDEMYCPEGVACFKGEDGFFGYEWVEPRPYPTIVRALWNFYPIVVWMAYVFAGILVGRMALRSWRALFWIGGVGIALAVIGYGGSAVIGGEQRQFLDIDPGWWKSASPHTYTPFEVTGNLGVALTLLALCCAVTLVARWMVIPFSAVGAMALTAYTAHIVVVWWFRNEPVFTREASTFLWFVGVAVLGCVLWRYTLGRGPLERLLHSLSMRAADAEPSTEAKSNP